MPYKRLAIAGALVLVTASVAFWNTGCSVVGIRNWEERAGTTLVEDGKFSIREYEPSIIARTRVDGEFRDIQGEAFGRLGGYIFGDNEEKQTIAMTMPVDMTPIEPSDTTESEQWEMTFFMPSKYELDELPTANDDNVILEEIPGETVAVFRYTGVMRTGDKEKYAPRLIEWLREQGYKPIDNARVAGYDPPFTIPFLRRNEIIIPVEQADPLADGS